MNEHSDRVVETFPHAGAGARHGEPGHFVQFYERDAFLLDTLSGYIHAGLRAGEPCVVITTPSHREGLEDRLRASGVDVQAVEHQRMYTALDAAHTLSRFMVDGCPEPRRFMEVIGGLFITLPRHPIRAFGEMVALLYAEGNRSAASQLEQLWNDLGQQYPFSLFCAYPMSAFGGVAHGEPFGDICSKHTTILPVESYAGVTSMDDASRLIAHLHQKALSLEVEMEARTAAEAATKRLNEQLQRKIDEYDQVVQNLEDSRDELRQKMDELENFHDVVVGRELKMMELERQLRALRQEKERSA